MITIQPRKSSLQQTLSPVNSTAQQTSSTFPAPLSPPSPPPLSLKKTVILKSLILGDSGVGKTALFNRITRDTFNPYSKPTAGIDFSNHYVKFDQCITIKAQLVDTSGLERYRSVTQSYWGLANGTLMVFDVSNRSSFAGLQRWAKDFCGKFQSSSTRPLPVVMVIGNKCDLAREVETEEAQAFALSNNFLYMETSALNNTNVSLAFNIFIIAVYHLLEEKNRLHQPPASFSSPTTTPTTTPTTNAIDHQGLQQKKKQRPKSFDEVFFQSVSTFFRESVFSPQVPPPPLEDMDSSIDEEEPRSASSSASINVPMITMTDLDEVFSEPKTNARMDFDGLKPLQASLFRSNSISSFGNRRKSRYL